MLLWQKQGNRDYKKGMVLVDYDSFDQKVAVVTGIIKTIIYLIVFFVLMFWHFNYGITILDFLGGFFIGSLLVGAECIYEAVTSDINQSNY